MKMRYGSKKAKEQFSPIRGEFPHANFPLSVVQIDHTVVDIILVDEVFRKPIHRPFITVAIDVFSRMVLGINLSFDPPGAMGTGLCIANSILPKEMYLQKLGVNGEWPNWGIMSTIHVDNAREFRGNMLKKACSEYGMSLEFRPVATPHYGGHIERLMGTFSKKIHDLPGTTFSNIAERDNYPSEKSASFTLEELEKWLITFIVNVYHKTVHSGIGMTPEEKYHLGVHGNDKIQGTGLSPRFLDERKIRLDFMPYIERTVQQYGVIIDHIYYYSDVLRRYINSKDKKGKRKFLFRRNPKDISVIYFLDPDTKEYYDIPYRNASYPPITLWEYRDILRKLVKEGNNEVNEAIVFEAYKQMEEIELNAVLKTKKQTRKTRRMINRKINTIEDYLPSMSNEVKNISNGDNPIETKQFIPFEDLDDEAFI